MENSWNLSWTPDQVSIEKNGKNWMYELVTAPYCALCGRKYWKKICWDEDRHNNMKLANGVFHFGFYHADYKEKEYQDNLSEHIIALKSNSFFAEPIGTSMAMSIINNYQVLLDAQLLIPVPSFNTECNHAFSLCEFISKHLESSMGIKISIQVALDKIKNYIF